MLQQSMQLSVSKEGILTIVEISGAVNSIHSPKLRAVISEAFTNQKRGVVVNLSGVTYMDSSGLATLVEGVQFAEKQQGKFVLAGEIPEKIQHLFEITRLDGLFERYKSIPAAIGKIFTHKETDNNLVDTPDSSIIIPDSQD